MPRPPCRSSDWSTCAKSSKISVSFAGGMPMPSSVTEITSVPGDATLAASPIVPPVGVYFTALPTRLESTCTSRSRSASSSTGSGRHRHAQVLALGDQLVTTVVHRGLDDLGARRPFPAQLQRASRDA